MSKSLVLAKSLLNKKVEVFIDRPLGSKHPKHNFEYLSNYGYIKGVLAPDGKELDAYYLGVDKPIEKGTGMVIAIVHRFDDDDSKLVVVPESVELADDEIETAVGFQEQWFEHEILR